MTANTARRDYAPTIRAMGEDTVTIDALAERLGIPYAQSYERIRAMRLADLIETVRRGRSGTPALYRLKVSQDVAIATMNPPQSGMERYDAIELEKCWPYRGPVTVELEETDEQASACA